MLYNCQLDLKALYSGTIIQVRICSFRYVHVNISPANCSDLHKDNMEPFSAILERCRENAPFTGGFHTQRAPVMWRFHLFFATSHTKSWRNNQVVTETPWCSCDVTAMLCRPNCIKSLCCSGDESRIEDCSHGDWGMYDCSHFDVVGAKCGEFFIRGNWG